MATLKNMARAGLQSGSIMLVSDAVAQLAIEGKSMTSTVRLPDVISKRRSDEEDLAAPSKGATSPAYDPLRTIRWSSAGLFMHGPYFFAAFSLLDRRFGTAASMRSVLTKTAVAQFVAFPPYLLALFTYLGVLEGRSDVVDHVKTRVPDAFLGGCVFWPVANVMNFMFVPAAWRVPYLAGVGSAWNCFLSWLNAHE